MKSYVPFDKKYEARKIYRKIGICPKRFDIPMSYACFHIGVFGLHYGLWGFYKSAKEACSTFLIPSSPKYFSNSSSTSISLYNPTISNEDHPIII